MPGRMTTLLRSGWTVAPLLALCCIVWLAEPTGAQARPSPPSASLGITGVTVIDVRDGRSRDRQTVVIAGNRIHAVGPERRVRVPKGVQVVDGRGKYLIPGLWDMHTHVLGYPQVFFPLLIAHGITGIRDMHGKFLDSLQLWRREIASGARVGPRMVVTGGFLGNYGPDSGWISHMEVPTPERARAVVDSLKAAGADFIKVRQRIKRDVYFAIAAHARQVGIPLVGHLSDSVTAVEASDSGQRTIEHDLLCQPREDQDGQIQARDTGCAALAAHLRRNGAWITPTNIALLNFFRGLLPDRAQFWPDSVLGRIRQRGSEEFARDSTRLLRTILPSLAMLRRVEMPLLAGTDAAPLFPQNTPGLSLHEELTLFQQAGFSPLEALQTATINPARYLRATDSLGVIEPGKAADLVLLDANPLGDITNTTKIRAVVANGRYFDRAALDRLLREVQAQATQEP